MKHPLHLLVAWAVVLLPLAAQAQADSNEKLTTLVVQSLPLGEVFETALRDPSWPLGDKASRVSPSDLQCLRRRLSSAGYRELRAERVRVFVERYPDKVADSLRVLEQGGAELARTSFTLGLQASMAGRQADIKEVFGRFTPAQLAAFVELSGDEKHRQLRELIGMGEAASAGRAAGANQGTRASARTDIGLKLKLEAMEFCKIPLAAVQ